MADNLTVADLKGYITAETNFPAAQQSLYLDGAPLSNINATLQELGVKDGAMLAALMLGPGAATMAPRRGQAAQGQGYRSQGQNPMQDMGRPDMIEATRMHILSKPQELASLRQARPELAAAVNDPVRFAEMYTNVMREDQARQAEMERQHQLLNDDPFNVDAQRKIEEMIRQERVMENLEHAMNYSPEGAYSWYEKCVC